MSELELEREDFELVTSVGSRPCLFVAIPHPLSRDQVVRYLPAAVWTDAGEEYGLIAWVDSQWAGWLVDRLRSGLIVARSFDRYADAQNWLADCYWDRQPGRSTG